MEARVVIPRYFAQSKRMKPKGQENELQGKEISMRDHISGKVIFLD